MRGLKILLVLLLSLGLMVATGDGTLAVAADSHATHFTSDRGPHLDQDEGGCTTCHAAGNLQCDPNGPLFRNVANPDGPALSLDDTDVCDPCHSPGGVYPGGTDPLNDPGIGAKANWAEGVYVVIPDWCQNTSYRIDDIVKYNDTVYRCLVGFTSGTSFVESNWESIGPWRGAWQQNTVYLTNDVVKYDVRAYRCLADFTSGSDFLQSNWEFVVLQTLKPGKEKWCAPCHDDDPATSEADGSGVAAPNVMGDNVVYGFNVSGHGRPGAEVKCEECHDLTATHIDGEHRTYSASSDNYTAGYRLNTDFPMDIPRIGGGDGQNHFALCYKGCHHEYTDQFNTSSPSTNFRDDRYSEPRNWHEEHLQALFTGPEGQVWDSDWDGENCGIGQGGLCADSAMSCPACHNVHGSRMEVDGTLVKNPVMIRHGELISTPGSTDKVPAFDFHWYYDDNHTEETAQFEQSQWGGMLCGYTKNLDYNHVCYGCHNTGEQQYKREPIGWNKEQVVLEDFEAYTDDAGLQAVWANSKDAKNPRLEPASTGVHGPDDSQCMRVRVKWTRKPDAYGQMARDFDPVVDMTDLTHFTFYVMVNNTSKFQDIRLKLRRNEDNVYCVSVLSASLLEDGKWYLASLPRDSFSPSSFGLVNKIQIRINENDPDQAYAQNVFFDDLGFVKPTP